MSYNSLLVTPVSPTVVVLQSKIAWSNFKSNYLWEPVFPLKYYIICTHKYKFRQIRSLLVSFYLSNYLSI